MCVASINKLHAQTEPMYAQYMYNMLSINPAYAGNRDVLGLSAYYRQQWKGIPGAPRTASVSLDAPVGGTGIGIGGQFFNDQLGIEKYTGINGMLSQKIKVSETGTLSVGLSMSMMDYNADLTQVPNRFTSTDAAFNQNFKEWLFSVGIGIFYNTNNFYAGISVPRISLSRLSNVQMVTSNFQKTNEYHIFFTSGYVINYSDDIKIKPSFLLKAVAGAPLEVDLNTNIWLKNIIGLGASYRTGDAVLAMFELQANKQFRIGYAYEIPVSALNGYTVGTHELLLRYEFGRSNGNIKSTRYF